MTCREEILSAAQSVPSMPASAVKVIQLLRDPDTNATALMRTIELDPGLTSNVLHLANSAYYGGSKTISSLREAIVRLGTEAIFQMVVVSAAGPLARPAVDGYDLPPGALWEHSVAVALAASQLSEVLNLKTPGYTFTAALLHDIGKIVLGTFVDVDAAPIMEMAFQKGLSFEEAEKRVLEIDHAETGAFLLKNWGLPTCIVDVVRWHHNPEGAADNGLVIDLVHCADELALVGGIGTGTDGLNYRPSGEAMSRLKLTTNVAEAVMCQVATTMEDLRDLLNIGAGR